jgi:tetratricopeptide (TPR) repeat protein
MRARKYLVLAAGAAVGLGLVLYFRRSAQPVGSLSDAAALAEASRFDEAEQAVLNLLRRDPDDPGANLLAAQIAVGRSDSSRSAGEVADPEPLLAALRYLGRVRAEDRKVAALAKLWQGKAEYHLGRIDDAEASWNEALRLDPAVPEAGWSLLEVYYLEQRPDDARRLALRLHEVEPDRRDRVQLLLELFRQSVQGPDPTSLVEWFEPIVKKDPKGFGASLALGSACVRKGDYQRGLGILRDVLERSPDRPEAWAAWLSGLQEAGDVEALSTAIAKVPAKIADLPRLLKYRARVAQERGDLQAAARDYRLAYRDDPTDLHLQYRLSRVLRQTGETAEAERLERHRGEAVAALVRARTVYEKANRDKTLGHTFRPDLYREIADLCEAMGQAEESLAWHRLILQDLPKDPDSLSAVSRLRARASLP